MIFETNENIIAFWKHLGGIPSFLEKYLSLDILKRLKKIDYSCGMDYASKSFFDFPFYFSRYDHSLNVALLTWHLTKNKCETIAGLVHDISTPIFSHVIDYMKKDYIVQEETEHKTEEILKNSLEFNALLKEDSLNLDNIFYALKHSIVDNDRPKLCVDRLDAILTGGLRESKQLDLNNFLEIVDDLEIMINEYSEEEIGFKTKKIATKTVFISNTINEMYHSQNDMYCMDLLAKIVEKLIKKGFITEHDLYVKTEDIILDILNTCNDLEIKALWNQFTTGINIEYIDLGEIKNKVINPLVNNVRFNDL